MLHQEGDFRLARAKAKGEAVQVEVEARGCDGAIHVHPQEASAHFHHVLQHRPVAKEDDADSDKGGARL